MSDTRQTCDGCGESAEPGYELCWRDCDGATTGIAYSCPSCVRRVAGGLRCHSTADYPVFSRNGQRGSVLPDRHFERVASIYEAARNRGDRAPTLAVASQLRAARSNAGRWVMEARRRGLMA